MSEEAELKYAHEVFAALIPTATVELVEQSGHRFLKVTDGDRVSTLQMRTDQAVEIQALGSEMYALRRLAAAQAELAVTRRALEKESARVLELEAQLRDIGKRVEEEPDPDEMAEPVL